MKSFKKRLEEFNKNGFDTSELILIPDENEFRYGNTDGKFGCLLCCPHKAPVRNLSSIALKEAAQKLCDCYWRNNIDVRSAVDYSEVDIKDAIEDAEKLQQLQNETINNLPDTLKTQAVASNVYKKSLMRASLSPAGQKWVEPVLKQQTLLIKHLQKKIPDLREEVVAYYSQKLKTNRSSKLMMLFGEISEMGENFKTLAEKTRGRFEDLIEEEPWYSNLVLISGADSFEPIGEILALTPHGELAEVPMVVLEYFEISKNGEFGKYWKNQVVKLDQPLSREEKEILTGLYPSTYKDFREAYQAMKNLT